MSLTDFGRRHGEDRKDRHGQCRTVGKGRSPFDRLGKAAIWSFHSIESVVEIDEPTGLGGPR
jgi:hypothetical protein